MEEEVEEVKKAQLSLPLDVMKEILNRLPLKSLARFVGTSKLWFCLINTIICGRLLEEMDRRMLKLKEAQRNIKPLWAESNQRDGVIPVKAKEFDDDICRCLNSMQRIHDHVSELRDLAEDWVRRDENFLHDMDALIDTTAALKQTKTMSLEPSTWRQYSVQMVSKTLSRKAISQDDTIMSVNENKAYNELVRNDDYARSLILMVSLRPQS
ncbi:uncharacterized protein A4U43_C08F14170 [Asparagus officinalis]|nr:uncharacterized protein A4U43_C08F14170 [Asparagus officinalis]